MFLGLIFSLKRTQVGIPFEVEFRKIELVMKQQMNLEAVPVYCHLRLAFSALLAKYKCVALAG